MRCCIIENDIVVNIVEYESVPSGTPPGMDAGAIVMASDVAQINWTLTGNVLVAPASIIDLPSIKNAQTKLLALQCAAAIEDGYSSSALGSAHTYPSNVTDQINMMGSVTASLLPGLAADWSTPFWCADASGTWDYRNHSATQIQQAGSDGKAHVVECQTKLAALTTAANAASTADAVAAVVWS